MIDLATGIIASIGSFLVGMGVPLAFVYPKITSLETKVANACEAISRIESGKVNINCPRHEELMKRIEDLEHE